jgi:hypothetical protein
MRQRHRFVPTASNRLEDRVALSHGMMGPAAAQVVRLAAGARQAQTLDLRGTIFGTEVPTSGASGVVLRAAKAYVYPLRKVSTVGTLSIRSGEPTAYDGMLTLTALNHPGAIQVHISGIQGGPTGPPANLSYEIVGGRGDFRGATGRGNVVFVQELPVGRGNRRGFTLTFGDTTPTTTA